MKGRFLTGMAAGALALLLVAVAAWLAVVYTGAYNVAASESHADIVRWSLDKTMHRSVSTRAEGLAMPQRLGEEAIRYGAGEYGETCVHCHGAPGRERAEWARNMRPAPPELVHAARNWEPTELFWIIKHGIRMTAMPAFGPGHSDEQLWGVAAFVAQLPAMTAQEYAAAAGEGAHGHGHGNGAETKSAIQAPDMHAPPSGQAQ